MLSLHRCSSLLATLLLIGIPGNHLAAAHLLPFAPPSRDTVTDRVLLKDGPLLRGLLISDRPLRLLVRSEWLAEHSQQFLDSELRPLLKNTANRSRNTLRPLVQQELDSTPAVPPPAAARADINAARRALLQDLLERLAPEDPQPLPDWLLLEFPRSRVQKLEQVPDERRNLCRLAMLNKIPQLEQLPWKTVQEQLEAIPDAQRITIFIGPSPGQPEEPQRVFEGILAAVDIRSGAATRVIQSGQLFVNEASPGDITQLFHLALQQQLQGTLSELLAEASGSAITNPSTARQISDNVPPEAVAIAQQQGSRTLVISSSQTDLISGSAIVSRRVFLQRDSQWRLLFALQEQARLSDIPADRAQQLADTPQIQQMTQIVAALGIGDHQLQTALNMGAVVQQALSRLQARFDEQLQALLTARCTSTGSIPLLQISDVAPPKNVPAK